MGGGEISTELGVDPPRLAVGGSSAGATLAACLAHGTADGSLPAVAFQLLHQPVLDDRETASKAEFCTSPAFDSEAADLMWRYYLGPAAGSVAAVPARRDRLGGLPTALITCAEIDPFRDEAVDYALQLLRAGVSTELHVFPRTCHGFDSLLPIGQRPSGYSPCRVKHSGASGTGPERRGTPLIAPGAIDCRRDRLRRTDGVLRCPNCC